MNSCNHSPDIPFLITFKKQQSHKEGGQLRFRCRKCGRMITTNKYISLKKYDYGIRFATLGCYFCVRESIINGIRMISDFPNLIIRLFTVIFGTAFSAFLVNTIVFVFFHCIRWHIVSTEQID